MLDVVELSRVHVYFLISLVLGEVEEESVGRCGVLLVCNVI